MPETMRKVRLIGGEADGQTWPVPEYIRPGDFFRVYVVDDLPTLAALSIDDAPPDKVEAHDHLYKLHAIYHGSRGKRAHYYGAPEKWEALDAMSFLFGPSEHV